MMTAVRRTALLSMALTLLSMACSGEDRSRGPNAAEPSSGSAAADTVAATTAPTTSSPATTTTTTTTTATTTLPPATTAATTIVPGAYGPAPAPVFPSRAGLPGEGLPDGTYYGVIEGAAADPPRVAVTIYELLTGPDAIAAAQADGAGLDSDIYVRPTPSAAREIVLAPDLAISVAQPDRPGVSWAVTPAELLALIGGGPPSAGAPEGYRYLPFPFLITVAGGQPARLEQLWSP